MRIVGGGSLEDGLNRVGVSGSSGLFRIEGYEGGEELNHPGWVSRGDDEGYVQLTLFQDFQ
jgi:hypothetical protein